MAEILRGIGWQGAASLRRGGDGKRGDRAVVVGDEDGKCPDMWVPGPACQ